LSNEAMGKWGILHAKGVTKQGERSKEMGNTLKMNVHAQGPDVEQKHGALDGRDNGEVWAGV